MDRTKRNLKNIFDTGEKSVLNTSEKEDLYKTILKEARRTRVIRLLWQSSAVAAILIVGMILFFNPGDEKGFPDIRHIAAQSQGAFVEDNTIQIASLTTDQKSFDITAFDDNKIQENMKLSLPSEGSNTHYSTLYVPYGRRQEILLPDGSTVWLNAGSFLTFSNNMMEGKREVYLNGEGFFDIKHTGSQFVVRTRQADIAVLGTSFNASSYEDETVFSVELLSGKVELNSPKSKFKPLLMNPGERVAIDFQNNTIQSTKQTGGDDILWTKKQLALKNVKMRDLLKRMERIYNVEIRAAEEVYTMDIGYSGRLNVGVDIVTSLSSIYELRNYDILLKEKEVSIIEKE
ncbi:MAG TPA: FecR domain-containing protein [Sphingobacterium sp.]|nr:FecR domain-containing protein [Sphingobacterium sp.]